MRHFKKNIRCPFVHLSICPLGINEFCCIFAVGNLKFFKAMAVLTKHILGVPSGSIADSICFSSWKGKACLRSLPTSVADPNTTAQQAVRAKFSLIGQTLVPLSNVVNIGWKSYERTGRKAMTALNAYVKYHLKDVDEASLFNGTYPDFESLNADKLLLSRGSLSGPNTSQAFNGTYTLTFGDDYEKTNIAYVVLYCPESQAAVYGHAETSSTTVSISVEEGDDWSGDIYWYVFVTDADGKKASPSVCVGKI